MRECLKTAWKPPHYLHVIEMSYNFSISYVLHYVVNSLKPFETKTNTFANSVGPDETARLIRIHTICFSVISFWPKQTLFTILDWSNSEMVSEPQGDCMYVLLQLDGDWKCSLFSANVSRKSWWNMKKLANVDFNSRGLDIPGRSSAMIWRGDNLFFDFLLAFLHILPYWSKFFPFRVEPLQKGQIILPPLKVHYFLLNWTLSWRFCESKSDEGLFVYRTELILPN